MSLCSPVVYHSSSTLETPGFSFFPILLSPLPCLLFPSCSSSFIIFLVVIFISPYNRLIFDSLLYMSRLAEWPKSSPLSYTPNSGSKH
ncbi:hypothetical protein BDV36DRAFT_245985 [Aspergillus pseudocaelatus]|uniref:Uncharacterized protein n=1 Tax=Aspergillus pseudocaelatus TaxID=1825620 RepID=A0ABQ6WYH7_9EURO|nr:hypothetical protein BDV36DRAFT_245985 [Aspergillus pseudocaelatus]